MNLETYISECSKYIITIIMVLYTLEGFLVFLRKDEEKRKGVYMRQTILMFAFHFSSFMVICFETGEMTYLFFYVFQQIVLYATLMLYKGLYPRTNRLIINNMCMLISIGFVFLTRLDYSKAVKQFMIASASLAIALIIPFFVHNLKFIKNLKWAYALIGIFLLGVVYILGATTYGSKISYTIGGVSFQPAEFVKIIFVFFIASALYESCTITEVLLTAIIAAIHVGIQVLNKDLGSALIFFVIYIFMVFISSGNILYLLLGMAGGAGASVVAYKLFSHVRVRVEAFLDPFSVIDSSGYQITQSLFAISSGGYFGLGLYKGTPDSIPFVEDDFIFSAIAEEMGIIFAVCVILICVSIFIMIMNMSSKMQDRFYQLTAFGLGIGYIFQVFLTIGGGSKFIPLTGVTLPLVSYGGSSMLTTTIMFAIIEGLYMIREDEKFDEGKKATAKNKREDERKRRAAEKRKKEKEEARREREYYARHGKYAYEDDDIEDYSYNEDDEPGDEPYDDDDIDEEFLTGQINLPERYKVPRRADNNDNPERRHSEPARRRRNEKRRTDRDYDRYDEDDDYDDEYENDDSSYDEADEINIEDLDIDRYSTIYYDEEEYEKERRKAKKK